MDVDAQNGIGYSALMYASQRGYTDVAERLIKGGAGVNLQELSGKTALMLAIMRKHLGVVKLLLETAHADVTITDEDGKTALVYAINNIDDVKGAVQQAAVNQIMKVVSHAADPVRGKYMYYMYKTKPTPQKQSHALVEAVVSRKDEDRVKALLDKGADPNSTDGIPVLISAVIIGDAKIVKRLIDARADVNARDSEHGATALMIAIILGYPEIVSVLLNAGADIDLERESDGATAVSLSKEIADPEIKKLFRDHIDFLVDNIIIKSFGLFNNATQERFNFFNPGSEIIVFDMNDIKNGQVVSYVAPTLEKKK